MSRDIYGISSDKREFVAVFCPVEHKYPAWRPSSLTGSGYCTWTRARGCWAQERHAAIFETGSGTAVNLGISGNSHSDCCLSSSIKTAIIGRNEGPTDCIQTSSLPRTAGSHLNAFHKGMLPRQHFSGPVAPSLCCRKTITTLIVDYNNRPSPTRNRSPIWILQDHMEHEWAFNRSLYFPRLDCNFRPLAANTAVWFDCGSFFKSPLKSRFNRSRRVAAMAVVNFRKSFRNARTAKYPPPPGSFRRHAQH